MALKVFKKSKCHESVLNRIVYKINAVTVGGGSRLQLLHTPTNPSVRTHCPPELRTEGTYLHAVDFIVISMVAREATVSLPFRSFPVVKVKERIGSLENGPYGP